MNMGGMEIRRVNMRQGEVGTGRRGGWVEDGEDRRCR